MAVLVGLEHIDQSERQSQWPECEALQQRRVDAIADEQRVEVQWRVVVVDGGLIARRRQVERAEGGTVAAEVRIADCHIVTRRSVIGVLLVVASVVLRSSPPLRQLSRLVLLPSLLAAVLCEYVGGERWDVLGRVRLTAQRYLGPPELGMVLVDEVGQSQMQRTSDLSLAAGQWAVLLVVDGEADCDGLVDEQHVGVVGPRVVVVEQLVRRAMLQLA